jgi:hypothetical protein
VKHDNWQQKEHEGGIVEGCVDCDSRRKGVTNEDAKPAHVNDFIDRDSTNPLLDSPSRASLVISIRPTHTMPTTIVEPLSGTKRSSLRAIQAPTDKEIAMPARMMVMAAGTSAVAARSSVD